MKKLFLILLITLITTPCSARFMDKYNEAVLVGQMVTVTEDESSRMVCQTAYTGQTFSKLTYADGINFYNQDARAGWVAENTPCLVHVTYLDADKAVMEATPGYLGKGHAVVNTPEYRAIVTQTIKDMESYTDEQGVYHEYTGIDANDPYPIWVYLRPEYQDVSVQSERDTSTVTVGE